MNMVDDATGTVEARMGKEETIWAAVRVLETWIGKYGSPQALYTDWKNVYRRKATPAEQLRGEVPLTQFGRMCRKLGIEIIAASSPQAKGRVERNHGIHQDRLVKKMRRKGIATYEAANAYLEREYLPQHNRRFAQGATQPQDYHGRKLSTRQLREIFRLETERAIGKRLGDPAREPFSATAAEATTLWIDPEQGSGLPMGRRNDGGVLPRRKDCICRVAGTGTKTSDTGSAYGADHSGKKSESRPSVETKLQKHGFSGGVPGKRNFTRYPAHFRFALKGFAPVRRITNTSNQGDISTELRMGTFLKSFDICKSRKLTER
jgi:hypothetical protein